MRRVVAVVALLSGGSALAGPGAERAGSRARSPAAAAAAEAAVASERPGAPSLPERIPERAREWIAAHRPAGADHRGAVAAAVLEAVQALGDAIASMRQAPGPHQGGVSAAARDVGDAAAAAAAAAANAAADAHRNAARRGTEHPAFGRRPHGPPDRGPSNAPVRP
jgi:hypothetical protein